MTPLKILLVEDDSSVTELIEEALKDITIPCSLDIADDGMEAIAKLRANAEYPQFVILDLNLPKKSGMDVLREIKKDPRLRVIPVIVMTSSYSHAYLKKPLLFNDWVRVLNTMSEFWAVTVNSTSEKNRTPI